MMLLVEGFATPVRGKLTELNTNRKSGSSLKRTLLLSFILILTAMSRFGMEPL